MIILKVRRTWKHVSSMPLFRALILDGAIYYCVFVVAFSLDSVASASIEVGVTYFYCI